MRVELSRGSWAEMAETLDHISNDQRDEIECLYVETPGSTVRKMKALNRALITAGVLAWSLDEPIPSEDASVLGRISGADGKALETAAWGLRYSTAPVDFDPDPSAGSPFSRSEGSATPSRAERPTRATRSPKTGSAIAS